MSTLKIILIRIYVTRVKLQFVLCRRNSNYISVFKFCNYNFISYFYFVIILFVTAYMLQILICITNRSINIIILFNICTKGFILSIYEYILSPRIYIIFCIGFYYFALRLFIHYYTISQTTYMSAVTQMKTSYKNIYYANKND